ncbi:hypothetical protein TSH100_29040 [Azospirillum sp. TSH100]|uniref:hypothetical protein n=1 Tax=Azospirillum sp. TSH100 TaxID=652764 RepID=UPI000D61F68E|nr:hypothetical protein [Azospirillum sp. TSH100]PWC80773.1 hypothetical protein TSH100_29040 [Azospirillum sp. TSH100]QCG86466.1 hypothetical protein E6C72_01185 [Azospirillum sp. TSH100]
MPLSSERIDSIATLAGRLFAGGGNLDAVVRGVREANPDLKTVTGAMAAVMAEDPFREEAGFDLHLVDGNNHCWLITDKPELATGVVIAQRDEDE